MTLESQMDRGSTFHVYLPLPNLTGHTLFPTTIIARPVLMVLSGSDQPANILRDLSARQGLSLYPLRLTDDLDQVLRDVQPAALAWDMTTAQGEAWTLVQRLRSHPQFCQLPFILFNQESGESDRLATGVTNILMKPATGRTLIDTINALRPTLATEPVLIVDDDPDARQFYQRLIAEALPGRPIRLAEDGESALQSLSLEIPGLVILDLTMPKVDGFSVLEQLRANPETRLVPVLVMSGRILSLEDVQRLNYSGVTFQSKGVLSTDEAVASFQQALTGQDRLPPPTSLVVKQALAYLHQNYGRALSREEVAKAVGVSKNYLSEIFRQEMGLSPLDCLNRFRVQQAKELLRNTTESITAIAARVGFEDSAYFSRVFRKLAGQSPQEYRR
jgi:AraC-like DNA-binding protein/DNA-binding response OmpR family regulator